MEMKGKVKKKVTHVFKEEDTESIYGCVCAALVLSAGQQ